MAAPIGRGSGRWRHHHLPRQRAAIWQAEEDLLSIVKTPLTKEHIRLDDHRTIRTISTPPRDTVPIVFFHGLCSGSAIFLLNLDSLAEHRQVWAIDLPGFGQSFRFKVARHASGVERQFVQYLEEWRRKVKLEKFILLGHSMGGFISCAYALKYPQHVARLILDDPWGFVRANKFWEKFGKMRITGLPIAYRRHWRRLALKFNQDSDKETLAILDDKREGLGDAVMEYMDSLNAFRPVSGEVAFSRLSILYGFRARIPMLPRFSHLDQRIKVSFLIGDRSWVCARYMDQLHNDCPKLDIDVHWMEDCNHDIHITQADRFNRIVNEIGHFVDTGT